MNRVYYMLMKRQCQYKPINYIRRYHTLPDPKKNDPNNDPNNDPKLWLIVMSGYLLYLRYS